MIDVCFHYEEPNDARNQWNVALSHNPVRNAYVRNCASPTFSLDRSGANLVKVRDGDDLPDLPLVLISPPTSPEFPGKISLFEFEHPEECIYFVGSNRTMLDKKQMGQTRKPDHSVFIPTENIYTMYAWTALAITLYHRNYWK